MAVQAGEAYIPVRADMSDFGKQVEQGTDKAGGKIGGFAKKTALALGGAFAVTQVKNYFGTAIAGAREAIAIDKQTEAVIKSTGSAAGVTAEHIEELAGRLQKTQTINDEVTQSGANLLLTFTNIRNEVGKGNDVFDQTVELANDMSVALGQDMKSSSIQLGKALNDPIKGVSALQRVGVSFTESQKEQIKTLVASGDTLGAQKLVLAELDKQFGGSAAAQADAGAKMALAWDDLTETVGRMLIPVMDSLLGVLQPIAAWAAENPAQLKIVAAVVGGALVLAFTAWAASAAAAAVATIAATLPVIAIGAAIAALVVTALYVWSKWDEIWSWMRDKVTDTMRNISIWIEYWIDRVVGFVTGLKDRISSAASSAFDGLLDAVKAVVQGIARAWNKIDLSFKVPDIPGVPNRGERFDIIPDVPVPEFHTGGTFRAPPGQNEGLALLLDGERVLSPSESRAGGAPLVGGNFIVQIRPGEDGIRRGTQELRRLQYLGGA